ncbi:insulinase family protein [Marinobacter xestospongiae]|uniref:Protease 3 n=1 Tax=Marinobacter xestospongiae TaxID=994319 RepID=A0ABU3W2Z0_9GAMM|nr:insulinase family protein [Marinobacter xestospongiae]MDV2080791.1 insulinase family protein [Marinobacter xestospongiae]
MRRIVVTGIAVLLFVLQARAEVIKPPIDHRDYRSVDLANGLSVTLVRDQRAEFAAGAMSVEVGSNHDPAELPGLAHLLEHMVFSGSKHYPERGGFIEQVNQDGGGFNFNAYTTHDHTTYAFQVRSGAMEDALVRFADFLSSPLLAEEDVRKEIAIVDHEFQERVQQPRFETLSVFRKVLQPDHPFARFNTGNEEVFSGSSPQALVQALSEMFESYYVAENMNLVVVAPWQLDITESLVRRIFSDLPSAVAPQSLPPVIERRQSGPLQIEMSGRSQRAALDFLFPLPMASMPVHRYFGHLIASHSPGGLRQQLLARGWATGIATGAGVLSSRQALFQISLDLTPEGMAHSDQVISLIQAYLHKLSTVALESSRYDRQRQVSKVHFDDLEFGSVKALAGHIARNRVYFPADEALVGGLVLPEYDESALQQFLALLEKNNLVLIKTVPDVEFDLTERWTGASYRMTQIDRATWQSWQEMGEEASFSLTAETNPYLSGASGISASDESSERPVLLTAPDLSSQTRSVRAWFKQDKTFNNSKGSSFLAIDHPVSFESERHRVMIGLYGAMLLDELAKPLEQAHEAGLRVAVAPSRSGLMVAVYGNTAPQSKLLPDLVEQIRALELDVRQLARAQEQFARQVDQYSNVPATTGLALALFSELDSLPPLDGQLDVVRSVTVDELRAFHTEFWQAPALTAFFHGNWSRQGADDVVNRLRQMLQLSGLGRRDRKPVNPGLDESRLSVEEPAVSESAAILYARQPVSPKLSAQLAMTAQILNGELFDHGRNREAVAYTVNARMVSDYKYRGVLISVEAPGQSGEEVRQFIESRLEALPDVLLEMSEEQYLSYRDGLRTRMLSSRENLANLGRYWWQMLRLYDRPVDETAIALASLSSLSRSQLANFIESLFLGQGGVRYWRLGETSQ